VAKSIAIGSLMLAETPNPVARIPRWSLKGQWNRFAGVSALSL
jgi:hypothetical protein